MSVPSQDGSSIIRVLVVHPTRVERVRLIRPLRAHFGRNVEVCEASGTDEAEERLGESFFDVALVAQHVEGDCGLDLATRLTKISPETATLLVAEEETPALAAEVAQSAVCDYVVRGQIGDNELSRAISGAIRQIHLQRDYQQMVRRMKESHDQMDHLVRALSHDMNANWLVMHGYKFMVSAHFHSFREEHPHDTVIIRVPTIVGEPDNLAERIARSNKPEQVAWTVSRDAVADERFRLRCE